MKDAGAQQDREALTLALTGLIGRTGAKQFQMRESNEGKPTLFVAVALYRDDYAESASGATPVEAMFRLAERLIDGGECRHCGRATALTLDGDAFQVVNGPEICWYIYDPEAATFQRSCATQRATGGARDPLRQ